MRIDHTTVLEVINPGSRNAPASKFVRLMQTGAGYSLVPADANGAPTQAHPEDHGSAPAPTLFISPGWIDLHTHVLDGFTELGVPADSVGLKTGVHMVVDAGSAGEATLRGFTKYVVPAAKTKIRAWLNISSIGLVHLREVSDLRLIDVDKTVRAIVDNQPFVCGVKVRSSGLIVEQMGTQPLKLAILAAKEGGVPLMVHIGEAPPVIEDVLDLLGEGHVITHCFHGKIGHPWTRTGEASPALQRALDRGVLLDVGHGAASFSFDVAMKAIQSGHHPFTISTDAHIRNVNGPVYDLATTMTKLLACNLSLDRVIESVTASPAKVLGQPSWCDMDGQLKHATIFRVTSDNVTGRPYRDAAGTAYEPHQHIVPVAVITEEGLFHLNGL